MGLIQNGAASMSDPQVLVCASDVRVRVGRVGIFQDVEFAVGSAHQEDST